MTRSALTIDGLSVSYPNGFTALDAVSLSVPAGASVGVIGSSGCGKTTLLKAIIGLLPAGSVVTGRILLGGQDLLGLDGKALRHLRGTRLGYVGQDPFSACDPLRSVRNHVEEPWHAHHRPLPRDAAASAVAALQVDDARRRLRQRPHQWSGGMLQRATTAAATAHDPLLTLADEPTSALDTETADHALTLLRRRCASLLLVSHDLSCLARHTDRLVVIENGRILESGRSVSVLTGSPHRHTRTLVEKSSPMPLHRPPVSGEPRVELRGVSHSYRHRNRVTTVAADVDLRVRPGEIVGVVGPSGAGKSALLRLLSGQERPHAGVVLAHGSDLWPSGRSGPRLPRPGWVMPIFQDPVGSLDPRWPLWRTITEPLRLQGRRMSADEARTISSATLAEVGLGGIDVNRAPLSLSVGQAQRVAIVRATIADPGVIVADEPTASLDVESAATVATLLRKVADQGISIVAVSHDARRLRSYADRSYELDQGTLRDLVEMEADPSPITRSSINPTSRAQ